MIEIIEGDNRVEKPTKNAIIGNIDGVGSQIIFRGQGNRLVADGDVKLRDSVISFFGDNALLYLSETKRHPYVIKLDLWRDTTTYFGKNSYFNGLFTAIVSERKNLIIGSTCTFSFGIWIRTADPHLIYSIETHHRLNHSKSVVIGDHVWIGQNATVLKGSIIGSGSVLSASAVVANKRIGSNTVYAGNPARKIRDGVFYLSNSVHNYSEADTEANAEYNRDNYIFKMGPEEFSIDSFDKAMAEHIDNTEEREKKLRAFLIDGQDRNRFYIEEKPKKKSFFNRFFRDNISN